MSAVMDSASRPAAVVRACRLGMFVQALVINLTPLLFVPLRDQLGLSWEQLGRLVLINFTTQLVVDLVAAHLLRIVSLRALLVAAHLLAAVGLALFALAPVAPVAPYVVLVAGTVIFSTGCGLLEVFLSPVLNAVPSVRKSGDMALLHAFYPIGKLVVVLGTAACLAWVEPTRWPWIALAWLSVPLWGAWSFFTLRLPDLPADQPGQRARDLAKQPAFIAVLVAMACAGSCELALSQWISAFAQRGLGLSDDLGNVVGFGLFAVGMILGRIWYGVRGEGSDLPTLLQRTALLSLAVYLVAALSPSPVLALGACCFAGLAVSMLWPATLSLAAARWPLAGAMMFALLAAAGDVGAAFGAWFVGLVADLALAAPALAAWLPGADGGQGAALRLGLLSGALAPVGMLLAGWWLRRPGAAGVSLPRRSSRDAG